MDKLLELVDQPTTAAATTQEMDENLFKEFLTKKLGLGFSQYDKG